MPSASIVPPNDPTLMFTNAGMVQFKDVFLGLATPKHPRIADTQKCLRISGKHNDLEDVGRDTYHHTLFEMLGNWSFGDYYKPEAIEWAWELLTREWGLPKDRLYATVYRTDDEAEELWKKVTDIGHERIMRFDEKDNFWEMGETGPCGPCSEIHIDRGPEACDMTDVKGHRCEVNIGCARYIELWNLVFIQYSRDENGTLNDLPDKHVDTGMGLERIAAVLENVDGNYDGSLLRNIIATTETLSGRNYGARRDDDIAFRVLADHSRAVSFMIADGILPSNDGRGYVLRRLLRRAAGYGKRLGFSEPFFFKVCADVVGQMGDAFPELSEHSEKIVREVQDEEARFQVTLDRGTEHLETAVAALGSSGKTLPGDVAFKLYDTYGFPVDMTEDILRSQGLALDRKGFDVALEEQRERARGAKREQYAGTDFTMIVQAARERGGTSFKGAFDNTADSQVIALSDGSAVIERAGEGDEIDVVTSSTPFYGESGGQVGDIGTIRIADGGVIEVQDTQKPADDVIVHRGVVLEGDVAVGAEATLEIDARRREAIRLNHSATHLMHAAMRNHLGEGVQQAGSLVDPRRLRFDFSYGGPVSDEQLIDIESEVNANIRDNLVVTTDEMSYDDAIASGALAFFGDKYGDTVRVVRIGAYSVELCGGTHVDRTGRIGFFRLVAETGVAAGTRRVEAVTGAGAGDWVFRRDALLQGIAKALKSPEDKTIERIEKLYATIKDLEKKIESLEDSKSGDLVGQLLSGVRELKGTKILVAKAEGVEAKAMRSMSDQLRDRMGSGVVVLAADVGSKVAVTVAVTKDQTQAHHAGNLIKELAPLVDGRGGGKPDFAQAGGANPAGIDKLLEKANELLS